MNGRGGRLITFTGRVLVNINGNDGSSDMKYSTSSSEKVCGMENVGLIYDSENHTITGIPHQPGDFEFVIFFESEASNSQSKKIDKKLKIYINPDPKSLWKDLPSDKSDAYWKEDYAALAFKTPTNEIVAASQRGRSHAHEGKFRDDDFKFCVTGS